MYIKHPRLYIDEERDITEKLDYSTKMLTNIPYSDIVRAQLEAEANVKEYEEAIRYLAEGSLFKIYAVVEQDGNMFPEVIPTSTPNEELIFIHNKLHLKGKDNDKLINYVLSDKLEKNKISMRLTKMINEI